MTEELQAKIAATGMVDDHAAIRQDDVPKPQRLATAATMMAAFLGSDFMQPQMSYGGRAIQDADGQRFGRSHPDATIAPSAEPLSKRARRRLRGKQKGKP